MINFFSFFVNVSFDITSGFVVS